jgi:hypothetical protein
MGSESNFSIKKPQISISHWTKKPHYSSQSTVSRRVVINPESDSSKFYFWIFHSIVNISTKKTPKYWTPGYSRFPSMGLQNQNFGENVIFFWLWNGLLWKLISRVLFGFFQHIYTCSKGFLVSFSMIYMIFLTVLQFSDYRRKYRKECEKNTKF